MIYSIRIKIKYLKDDNINNERNENRNSDS